MPKLTLAHFEITADDVDGIAGFYAKLLGWKAEPAGFVENYTMLYEGGEDGMTGAVMDTSYRKQAAIVWFGTDDIEASIAEVLAAGGKRDNELHSMPDGRRLIYMEDPAGNLLGLTQSPPK